MAPPHETGLMCGQHLSVQDEVAINGDHPSGA